MMNHHNYLDELINECAEEYTATTPETTDEKLASEAIISIMTVLVYQGLKILLPELKEWAKLGAARIALERQEVEKNLQKFAEQKELDYAAAQKAATIVINRITEKNVEQVVKAIEARK